MARTRNPSPVYQSPIMTHPLSAYQSIPASNAPSAYQSTPTTNAPSAYQSNPATNAPSAYQSNHVTNAPSTYQPRGRGKNKCFWEESETKLLIEVLQDMASDPSWKTDGGFRSNYLSEVLRRILAKRLDFSKKVSPHIESKVKWLKTKFHIISDMLKQSRCSWNDVEKKIACERQWYDNYIEGCGMFHSHTSTNLNWCMEEIKLQVVAEGFKDAIHNLEEEQNGESGGENLGESHFSLSDDE
nr:hypothetical protein [Tanacetum cinerariifolium]